MPSSLNGTGVTFNDGTTLQSGAIPAANLGSGTANSNTFLRGDRTFATVPPSPPEIEILNTQIFTASGTWTKPGNAAADDTLIVACIGGGGSGAVARTSSSVGAAVGGGGGGGVALVGIKISDVPSSVAVTVGAGAASRGATANQTTFAGNNGGNSVFANIAIANGGSGGEQPVSGVGQGGAGGVSSVLIGNATSPSFFSWGGRGRTGTMTQSTQPIMDGLTGGGGAFGRGPSTTITTNVPASTGRLFGAGGNGAPTTGGAGQIPGGGGGGAEGNNRNATSGVGARGEVRCFVVRGRFSASAFFGID